MRRIERRRKPPEALTDSWAMEARQLIADFLTAPEREREARRVPINDKIIQSEPVRVALHQLFAGRCAYCESERAGGLGVEQHRPVSNAGGGRKRSPHHYAWLAYEWENLLLVCHPCSSRKRNLFPLRGPRAPLMTPLPRVRALESPKLLDPGYDRPEAHLDFTTDGRCWPRTTRGAATISTLELNREALVEERRNVFSYFLTQLDFDGVTLNGADFLKALDVEDSLPFLGAQKILRYRFLSSLAAIVGHFEFSFIDAPALIDSVLSEAAAADIREALKSLERVEASKEKNLAPTTARPPRPFTPPIRRIEIENFKAIDHIVIDMEPGRSESRSAAALMLLGENATGKTSVLEAVTLALVGSKTANSLAKARDYIPDTELGGPTGRHGPTRIAVEFWEGPPAELTIGASGLFEGSPEPRANVLAYGSRRYFKPGRRRRSRTGGPRGLFDASWTLPHPDLWLNDLEPGRFPEIARALAEILSLPPAVPPKAGPYIKQDDQLGACLVETDLVTPLSRHSDGYRSLFATAVDMLRGLMGGTDVLDAEGVVLIDEVETHLHPRWKMRLMSGLRNALPRVQFIVTTHDPLCLRGMGPGEVQVMIRDADKQIGLVQDLPDVSGMRIDQILTSEHFGMYSTLDPELQEKFDRYYALLRKNQGTGSVSQEIDRLRMEINSQQRLGQTARERLMLETIDRNLARRVAASPPQTAELNAQLDIIWSEAAEDGA